MYFMYLLHLHTYSNYWVNGIDLSLSQSDPIKNYK